MSSCRVSTVAIVAALRLVPLVAEITNSARCWPHARGPPDLLGSREISPDYINSILALDVARLDDLDGGLSKLGRCRGMILDRTREASRNTLETPRPGKYVFLSSRGSTGCIVTFCIVERAQKIRCNRVRFSRKKQTRAATRPSYPARRISRPRRRTNRRLSRKTA